MASDELYDYWRYMNVGDEPRGDHYYDVGVLFDRRYIEILNWVDDDEELEFEFEFMGAKFYSGQKTPYPGCPIRHGLLVHPTKL